MAHAQRTYSPVEANRALPGVRRLTGQISELMDQLPELQDQLRIAEYRMKRDGASVDDGDQFERTASALRRSEDDLVAAIRELEEMGVALKDPRTGLVDFYSYREGELVELCWKLGEDRVEHWHRIGEGFAGRKPL